MVNETPRSCIVTLITFSIFGVLCGIIGIIVLVVPWPIKSHHRYASLAYAGLSSVLALWNAVLHLMHLQDIWRTWLKGLRLFASTGIAFCIVNILSFFVFLIISIAKQEDISPDSFYVTSIWCIWSGTWSFLLFAFARRYRNEYADLTALLDF